MSRPLIGITSGNLEARFSSWELPSSLIPLAYVDHVLDAGGRPLLVPPTEVGVAETVAILDGLILSGGADIDPSLYGAEAHPETSASAPSRDKAELALLGAALERGVPILGICRGMELLNVAAGGTLDQHLPDTVGHEQHLLARGAFNDHEVELSEGSRAADAIGTRPTVKSHHHQAVDVLGDGLEIVGRSADGTVEALEDPRSAFVVGVQWHPEAGEDGGLFRALVDAARERSATRAS